LANGNDGKEKNVKNGRLKEDSAVNTHFLGTFAEDQPNEQKIEQKSKRGAKKGIPAMELVKTMEEIEHFY
jgi:hypothetical protein